MPTRRLAFIGSRTEGPSVAIYGMVKPILRVRGLPAGSHIRAFVDDHPATVYAEDGEYAIPAGDWLRCFSPVICRTLVCDVVSRDKVA